MQTRIASFFCYLAIALACPRAHAAFIDTPNYRQCTALASITPDKGVRFANGLLESSSETMAALHCRAMAHFTSGNYHDSAKDLANVYAIVKPEQLSLRSYVTRQAARALSKAGDTERALASLQRELWGIQGFEGGSDTIKERLSSDLLLDRAQLYADAGRDIIAIQELDHAVSLMPNNAQVLLARARIFERLGAINQAINDLEMILKDNPRHSEARGLLKKLR